MQQTESKFVIKWTKMIRMRTQLSDDYYQMHHSEGDLFYWKKD